MILVPSHLLERQKAEVSLLRILIFGNFMGILCIGVILELETIFTRGAITFSLMTVNITALNITAISIMALIIIVLSIA
jgi:hypothetical protein